MPTPSAPTTSDLGWSPTWTARSGSISQRFQGRLVGAGIRFFVADERRGDDEVHQWREGEVRADDGDVVVRVGDDRGLHPRATQSAQRRQNIVEKPVVMMVRHFVELGDVGLAHCARRLRIVGEPRGLQPATHQLQAKGFALGLLPVADWQPAILDREVVLGDAVGLTQSDDIGVDALLARRGR